MNIFAGVAEPAPCGSTFNVQPTSATEEAVVNADNVQYEAFIPARHR